MTKIENTNNIMLKDCQIIFRNFSGKEDQYNRAGNRNFCIILDEETADMMLNDGWNVKKLRDREDGTPGDFYIQASINYKNIPPRVVLVTSNGRTNLGEGEVDILDWAELEKVDVILRPYDWSITNKDGVTSGRKAYVKTLFATIAEDPLEREYMSIPETEEVPEVEAPF